MCGIAGLWSARPPQIKHEISVSQMLQAMHYRGPDSTGLWSSLNGELCLGHLRLAIQDISPLGHQPMHSVSKRFSIVFNGEIYNFKQLVSELNNNQKLKGGSDTEVILCAFEEWGVQKTVNKLEGMFAIAVYDQEEAKLWLVRDRLGEKPLYYFKNDNEFIFSSELKSLLTALECKQLIDLDELNHYFRYGYFSAKTTPFVSIRKLAPAHILCFTENDLFEQRCTEGVQSLEQPYWSVSESVNVAKKNDSFNLQQAKESTSEFEHLLMETVEKQSIADVDLGVFLSGGIDSSLVTAALQATSSVQRNTYTIAFDDPRYNEGEFAKKVAQHIGTNHTEIPLAIDECIESIKVLPELLDEPFADSSIIPTYLVTRAAKEHVTVCLSGDGGDELFAGYNRYISGDKFLQLSKKSPAWLNTLIASLLNKLSLTQIDMLYLPISKAKQAMGKIAEKDIGIKMHKMARLLVQNSPQAVYVDLLSFWRESPLLIPKVSVLKNRQNSQGTIGSGFYAGNNAYSLDGDFITNAMLNDQQFYLPCDNLFKVDRAAMLNSLEVRLPLLSHHIVEFANRLPLAYKIHQGKSKWIMRELLYKFVPKNLIERPKMGFSVPLNRWFKNELFHWAQGYLFNQELMNAANIDSNLLSSVWYEHQSNKKDHANALWTVICYLVWFEKNSDKIKFTG
jgi:asparagine synthase (glutamine-hydrolysing)